MDYLQGLNPQQREAVLHIDGPLLLLAGAGSGKTRVITHRIAHIIRNHHVPPSAVLAVTFTNKAAAEMRTRATGLLADHSDDRQPAVSTFHSFCVRLLRRDGDPLTAIRPGFNRRFTIYDDEDQLGVIKAAYKHLGLDEKFMKYRAALSIISHAKNRKETPQDMYQKASEPAWVKVAVIWEEYEKALRAANALDFDDLLLESVRLLRHDDATREFYNRRIQYLMIDEYQDTNRSQYELMRMLTQAQQNVCVVGDEDQSIYSWRGADIRNILDFERDYPSAIVIRLEQNYRSTKKILEAAGAVVANNVERKGKNLWTEGLEGEPIGLYTGHDGENEALFIADTIDRLIRQDPRIHVAVLYRTNSQSRQIEEALRRYGRSYNVVGGFSFYQRAEIKDVMAYLKLAIAPGDSLSLARVINTPARGIGKSTLDQIEQFGRERSLTSWVAIERMLEERVLTGRAQVALEAFRKMMVEITDALAAQPLPHAIQFLVERTGYQAMLEQENTPTAESRIENLKELVTAAVEAAERGEGIIEFLDHAALISDSDKVDERAQVNLLTMHNAKGLEFPVVFIAGMEEGLFPHSRSFDSPQMLEEERRLCYVGMTRAERRLFLTWARLRRRFGNSGQEQTLPSRFLREVPAKLIKDLGGASARSMNAHQDQVDLLAERHEVRESAKKNTYTGKTYNSLENITQFFRDRGLQPKSAPEGGPAPAVSRNVVPPKHTPAAAYKAPESAPAAARSRTGSSVNHPKYGRGTIVRREGDGDDAKLVIHFPEHGLKKLIARYSGLTSD